MAYTKKAPPSHRGFRRGFPATRLDLISVRLESSLKLRARVLKEGRRNLWEGQKSLVAVRRLLPLVRAASGPLVSLVAPAQLRKPSDDG